MVGELRPVAASSARTAASDVAISAGWALAVSVSCSAGPSKMIADSRSPSASSTSSNTARAAGKASARARPMPTDLRALPGKHGDHAHEYGDAPLARCERS